jgi:hypothetical protein
MTEEEWSQIPDVNLSIHPARATARKAAAFHCSSGLYEDAIVKGVFCWCLAILIALGYGYRRAVKPRSRLYP